MQSAFSEADQAFLDEIRRFIVANWPAQREPGPADHARGAALERRERAWIDALAARGWSVPHWPVEYGGTGWPSRWLHLWRRELALAGAPLLDEAGVEWAGPAVWFWGDAVQQARFLPAIRAGRERWCLGFVEPEAGSDHAATRTSARRETDGYVVDGLKAWVAGAERARWMLALARTGGDQCEPDHALSLLVVDLAAQGVTVRPVRMLGDLPGVCSVCLEGVRVPIEWRLGDEGAGLGAVRRLCEIADRRFEPTASLAALARRLEAAAVDLPGDDGPLIEDPGFARRLAELGVDLAGLEALELRHVWAEGAHEVLPLVLRLRHRGISQRIGELFVEAFGYYSLPYPDPRTIDNEGPIGHHDALAALRGMFAGRAQPTDASAGAGLRDRIANQLFGY